VVEDCKFSNPGLSIGLQVKRVLSGTVDNNISLAVGHNQIQSFQPLPTRADDGSVEWLPNSRPDRGPLRVGQRIMVGLHSYALGWSLMGDTILGIDSSGIVYALGRQADCLSTEPGELNGLDIEAVADKLSCTPDPEDVAIRRAGRDFMWGDAVSTHAASCTDAPPSVVEDMQP
jgi:hypothetical protein